MEFTQKTLYSFKKILHKEFIYSFLFILIYLISRYLFRSHYLFEWDSVHYALALEKFDVMWHTPHPPGYFLYVLFTRICHIFFPNPNEALISLNIILAVLTFLLTYILAKKIFTKKTAVISLLIMVFHPLFWFYSEVATIYLSEAFCASIVGIICWSNFRKQRKTLELGSFIFGMIGGFRQSLILLLMPLWLISLIKSKAKLTRIILNLFFLFLGIMFWYLPTIILSGGAKSYYLSSSGLSQGAFQKAEIFFGSIFTYFYTNFLNLSIWSIYLFGFLTSFLLILAINKYLKKNTVRCLVSKMTFLYFFLWLLPPYLFFLFVFIDKPGYLMIFLPAVCIIEAKSIHYIYQNKKPFFLVLILVCIIVVNIAWFVPIIKNDNNHTKINFPKSTFRKPPLSEYTWDISYREIKYHDIKMKGLLDIISEGRINGKKMNSDNTALAYRGEQPNWRQLSYYFPDFLNLWIIDIENSGLYEFGTEVYYSQKGKVWSHSGLPFWVKGERSSNLLLYLPNPIIFIIWFLPEKSMFYNKLITDDKIAGYLTLPNLKVRIPYSILKDHEEINAGNIQISRTMRK